MTQNPYDPQAAASPVSGGYFPGQVPGVPGAPAQRLVAMEEEPEESQGIVWKPQVLDALTSLGWSEKDASAAIDAYVKHNPSAESEPVGVALRGVLASLGTQNTVGRH